MKYVPRTLAEQLVIAAEGFPALILTGPRRAGKTTLLRHVFPDASYVLLEDPDTIGRVSADPKGFLQDLDPPVILDEIQNVPELLNYLRSKIDADPHRYGRWLLTGSQEAPLMRGITESMAGRAAIFQLLPFSLEESAEVTVLRGGFPEVLQRPAHARTWFRSYVQTYLERDVRAVTAIRDLATFRRFLSLVASRNGQVLNRTAIAAPLGVSVPTLSQWLSILEVTGQVILVPPFYENFGKRLVKSPRVYFMDTGLLCHLLGIETASELSRSPFLGSMVEAFVASEIVKHRIHRGEDRSLYFFRDRQGLEVDFLLDRGNRCLTLMEVKATRTPKAELAQPMSRLAGAIQDYEVLAYLVHSATGEEAQPMTLSKGVRAVGMEHLHSVL